MIGIEIVEAGPLTSVQDAGRFGALVFGVAASGPMDRNAFENTARLLGATSQTVLEIAAGRMEFVLRGGDMGMACCGGGFELEVNGGVRQWNTRLELRADDRVTIVPGGVGNYGYIRFEYDLDVPVRLNSYATNTIARFGGYQGRVLAKGDMVRLAPPGERGDTPSAVSMVVDPAESGPIRFIWGLHADAFSNQLRQRFVGEKFVISNRLDRMGVRLSDQGGVFEGAQLLSLVSDAVVPGDIQILGDGTPIVLMRDHQPTGGYPRIATIISADLSRFAQLRPGSEVQFSSVSVAHAQAIFAKAGPK
jgi:biotin-dependent carboxylase-like uncharacterized protein